MKNKKQQETPYEKDRKKLSKAMHGFFKTTQDILKEAQGNPDRQQEATKAAMVNIASLFHMLWQDKAPFMILEIGHMLLGLQKGVMTGFVDIKKEEKEKFINPIAG